MTTTVTTDTVTTTTVEADTITDSAGTGAPNFSQGITLSASQSLEADTITNVGGAGAPDFTNGIQIAGGTEDLDAYAENTFTPDIEGSGGAFSSVTYVNQTGTYTLIGNRVFFKIRVEWSAATGGTGNLQLSGLPFNPDDDTPVYASFSNLDLSGTDTKLPACFAINATDTIQVTVQQDNAAYASVPVSAATSGSFNKRIDVSGHYRIA